MKHKFKLLALFLGLVCIAATVQNVKNVLIVGDSISIGYTPFVVKALQPQVNVEHNEGNGGSTVRGLQKIEQWIGGKQWDVILFNFGLHDLVYADSARKYDVINGKVSVPIEQYKKNLSQIVAKLRETTATLIFINTTMVPENSVGRKVEDPTKYNEAAAEIMKQNGIKVIDLYTLSQTVHPANFPSRSNPSNVHYSENGYEQLAAPIIEAIRKAL